MNHPLRRPSALALLFTAALPLAAQAPCGPPHLVGLPHPPGASSTRLYDVHAFAPDDLWAVGTEQRVIQGQTHALTFILHWDGFAFTRIPSPSPAVPGGRAWCELLAVGGAAPDDVWAAGHYERQHPANGHVGPQILLLHWDGSSWTQVPEPIPSVGYMGSISGSRIHEIVAFAANDVRFFGKWTGDQVATPAGPATLRWNGSNVQIVDVAPNVNTSTWYWVDVDALSPTHLWAIGSVGSGNYGHYVAEWNGSSWTRHAQIPTLPLTYYDLFAVGAVAANDVWVAGLESPLSPVSPPLPYTIHWNGSTWTRIPTTGYVREFVVFASNDVWAFGTKIEHWNGSSWSVVANHASTLVSAQSWEATATGPCDLWTVGTQWASAGGPPVLALAAHVGAASAGGAALRLPCSTPPLRQSLLPLGTPRLGQPMRTVVDDPAGLTGLAGPCATAWLLAMGPGPAAPCGIVLPGFGPGGAPIEVLLDATATVFSAAVWLGPGQPAVHTVSIVNDPTMVGLTFASQAVFVTAQGFVATSALDLTIGI